MRSSIRAGMTLLEVTIALAILGSAGVALVALLGQARQTMHDVRATERRVVTAAEESDRLVLLDRADLVSRLGWTRDGEWVLHVVRVRGTVFDVDIGRREGAPPVLRTTLYRPDTSRER